MPLHTQAAGQTQQMGRTARRALAMTSGLLPVALALAPLASAPAQAQTATIGPEATARGVTVMSRPRPDYDPTGVRLGGFRLDGALEAGIGYDDNLTPGLPNSDSDAFFGQSLGVQANSTWTRHALGVTAAQSTRQHFSASDQNWTDWSTGINGRYDIGRASSLRAAYQHSRSHYSTENFDVQEGAISRPVPFDTDLFLLGGTAAFNRLTLSTTVDYRLVRYEDRSVGNVIDRNSLNDHNSLRGEFEADYSFVPGRSVVALVRLEDIEYQQSGQRGRDSFTWEVQGGIDYAFTGLWAARLLVGYRQRDYEDPSLKSLSGPAFEGTVTMAATQLTTITAGVSRTIEESIRASNVSYTRTQGRLTVDHELRRNIILTGELRAEHRDYPERGTVMDGIGLVGAQWLLNRNLAILASYQHTERLDAPQGLREYGINQFQVRLRISL